MTTDKLDCIDKTIKNRSFNNVEFESSKFKNVLISDIKLVSVKFHDCFFDSVIIEASHIEDIVVSGSEIKSISVRGNREITKGSIFKKRRQGLLKGLQLDSSNKIGEVSLKGNLQIEECTFPESENFLHIKNPYKIYGSCLDIIKRDWNVADQQLALTEIEKFYMGKNIEDQKEDFLTFETNSYLTEDQNQIIRKVFDLIGIVSKSS